MKTLVVSIAAAVAVVFASNAKESNEGLDGLFGVKFGKIMSPSEECMTNNVGELAYEYTPARKFRGYTDYVIFATPLTRQVSQVRAIARLDYGEAETEMDATILALEMKFDRKARTLGTNKKAIIFENGDYILIIRDGRKLTIDACCSRLGDRTKEEVKLVEKKRYAEDIRTLALLPKRDFGESRIYRIDSVFGIKFGVPYKARTFGRQNNAGAWVYDFTPDALFMGCDSYLVFTTEKTKNVFMVRTVYRGIEYETRRDQIRRVIESITGHKFSNQDEDSDDLDEKNLCIRLGDYRIDLEMNSVLKTVTVDFYDVRLFLQNEKEHKEVKEKAARMDLDAL